MAKRRKMKKKPKESRLDSHFFLAMVDELHRTESLLEMVPELTEIGRLVSNVSTMDDELARGAREALGLDLNVIEDDNQEMPLSNLGDVPNSADAVLDAARWRLRRLSSLLAVVARPVRG